MFEPLCFGELVGTIWSVEALSFNYNFFFLRCQGNFSLPRYTMLATPERVLQELVGKKQPPAPTACSQVTEK